MTLAVNDQLSEHGAVCRGTGGTTDPPLGSAEMGCVDHKLVRRFIEGCSSLKACYIGPVGELGHTEAADHAVQA